MSPDRWTIWETRIVRFVIFVSLVLTAWKFLLFEIGQSLWNP
jgi:hypothetical protein